MNRVLLVFSVLFLAVHVRAELKPFEAWRQDIKREAIERGISQPTALILDEIEPDPRVLEFDRRQPEFVQTFEEYLRARVSDDRVALGRQMFREYRKVLGEISDQYDVDPQYLVAFWGLESSFGRYQGKYSVVRSLATLAYDQRRSAFFTSELFSALQILDEGHIPSADFVGGWAGAMGQNQFLPSSFLRYAQDFDGDGKKDIWGEEQDVLASIANYLATNGWVRGAGWGTRVTVPVELEASLLVPDKVASGCRALRKHTRYLPLEQWRALGVVGDFSDLAESAYALVIPDAGETTSYLVGGNFRTILHYNCANKYAVSVGLMADLVAQGNDLP
ncbi:MAG: lytic murein transglycosylase [Pseudomonadales bacterium]